VVGEASTTGAADGLRWRRLVAASATVAIAIGCATTADARRPAVGHVEHGRASYYAPKFNGRKTASGERYDPKLMTAAGGASVIVKVNDRCGCQGGRIVDLSEAAARKLNMMKIGTAEVTIEVLGRS
jgi:rare lipoprotein A